MTQCLYQDRALEGRMYNQLYLATGYQPGEPIYERRIEETCAIAKSGHATLFALAWELTRFSQEQGYPVSFRGKAGSLLVSHLLGFAQNNPMDLNIPWQGAFSAKGRAPNLILNVAPELYGTARRYLTAVAVDCEVLWDLPGQPEYRVVFAPERYDPENFEYLTMDICPHELMSQVGDAAKKAGRMPRPDEVLSPDFIQKAWAEDMGETPILRDLWPLRNIAPELEPKSFDDLIRLLGLTLAGKDAWKQLKEPGVRLDDVIATREDVYDRRLRQGATQEEALDALRHPNKPTYLYTRGQCAEYLTYALTLDWLRGTGV